MAKIRGIVSLITVVITNGEDYTEYQAPVGPEVGDEIHIRDGDDDDMVFSGIVVDRTWTIRNGKITLTVRIE